jgi:hypothetical protein
MRFRPTLACLAVVAVIAVARPAGALPVALRDSNGTKYNINTQVFAPTLSNASGALTNATFVQPVTVTSYYIGFTPWFLFLTTYTVQRQVNVPLTPAFNGFNGLLVAGMNGQRLSVPLVFNPGQVTSEECPDSNGKNKQLVFATQTFAEQNLTLTRKVYVPSNQDWVRWLNIVTNTGPNAIQPAVVLLGLLASGSNTKLVATSTGDGALTTADLWFTTAQSVPQGTTSLQPRIGYVVQGPGAATAVSNMGISTTSSPPGKTAFSYMPTIPPGGTVVLMTFVTVQGKSKAAKNTCNDLVANPLPSSAIKCMSQRELSQVVNFEHITPPELKNATVKLKFKNPGQDTVEWKGKITIGAGISLDGAPVTVNFGGVTQTFVLNKKGTGKNGDGNNFHLSAELKKGVTKAGTYNFNFHMKGDLQTPLAQFGLTNADANNVPVSIPLTMQAGPGQYATDQPFTYKATAGKTGTAKTS